MINNLVIIQAHLGSKRLKEKILKKIYKNYNSLDIILKRLSKAKKINKIVVATSVDKENDKLIKILKKRKISFFRGNKNNVLKRFYDCSRKYRAKNIIRITADCPLIDPNLVDMIISKHQAGEFDYTALGEKSYPDGFDTEIFKSNILKKAYLNAKTAYEKEHVTPYMKNNKNLKIKIINNSFNYNHIRLTLDEANDLEVIQKVVKDSKKNIYSTYNEFLKIYLKNEHLFSNKIIRNEGAKMKLNQKLWKRAKGVIPGGNMLLSKKPEMFLPNKWPTYFKKSSGYKIWDYEGSIFTDMVFSVGTNVLGYQNKEIDKQVSKIIKKGTMSTLNCFEEVLLSEKLIELHPWADMSRFARSGGEANSIAIRLARAYTGKEKILFCGYHGWHDWYLSANLSNKKNLDDHLLVGLKSKGIPRKLNNTILPFQFNDINDFEKQFKKNKKKIACVIMEVHRNIPPKKNFLKKVRQITKKNNIVLIFDECTSGFRETFGGLHMKYKIYPDLVMFGKALGNGYPITAIVGRKNIMNEAQETFISSTMWTDRIGPTAALKSLEIMEKKQTYISVKNKGIQIKKFWKNIFSKYKLAVKIGGLDSVPNFVFKKDHLILKTIITQEFLKKNILASNMIFISHAHNNKAFNLYKKEFKNIIKKIKDCYNNNQNIIKLLDNEICHSDFKRLN